MRKTLLLIILVWSPMCSQETLPVYDELRLYQINWDYKFGTDPIIDAEGNFNESRVPMEGVILDGDQTDRAIASLTGEHEPEGSFCFHPHHGMVFFNEGEVVGHVSVCFMCSRCSTNIDAVAEFIDYNGLKGIFEESGLSIENEEWKGQSLRRK